MRQQVCHCKGSKFITALTALHSQHTGNNQYLRIAKNVKIITARAIIKTVSSAPAATSEQEQQEEQEPADRWAGFLHVVELSLPCAGSAGGACSSLSDILALLHCRYYMELLPFKIHQ